MTMNEMLLRGCMLKNSNYILGMVVYTGRESRIQMNAAKTPNKVGARPEHSLDPLHCKVSCRRRFESQLVHRAECVHALESSSLCVPGAF